MNILVTFLRQLGFRLKKLPGWMISCCSINVTLLSPHSTNQEQRYRPFANQHPEKSSLTLLNSETLKFPSCTSNLWEQKFSFWWFVRFSLTMILNIQTNQENRSFRTYPICSVLLYYPHDYVVECHSTMKKGNQKELNVFTSSCPFLWLRV